MSSSFDFVFNDAVITASVGRDGDLFSISIDDRQIELRQIEPQIYTAQMNGTRVLIAVARDKDKYYLDIDSVLIELSEPSADGFAGGAGDHGGEKDKIFAPMPGKIVKLLVAIGDEVTEKQPMVIVEAMKMENQVLSRGAGKVKKVNFADGDQVDTETPIIELELAE